MENKTLAHIVLASASVLAIILILGILDCVTGYELNFFVFYFVPVSLAAWRLGRGAAVAASILSALTWALADVFSGHAYSTHAYAVWNTMIRLCAFIAIGWALSRIRDLLVRERQVSEALQRSLSEVTVLEGLLPVCAQCKKIRNAEGTWQQMEVYIQQHSAAQFTHGYCNECARKVLEDAGLAPPRDEGQG